MQSFMKNPQKMISCEYPRHVFGVDLLNHFTFNIRMFIRKFYSLTDEFIMLSRACKL
jgi:hypothetical protein